MREILAQTLFLLKNAVIYVDLTAGCQNNNCFCQKKKKYKMFFLKMLNSYKAVIIDLYES